MAELPKLKSLLLNALNAIGREDGWASLVVLVSQCTRNDPSFDPCNYGVTKLGELSRQQVAYLYLEVKSGEVDVLYEFSDFFAFCISQLAYSKKIN